MRRFLTLFFVLSLFFAAPSFAEVQQRPSTDDIYSYIANVGTIVFTQGGGAFLPPQVLQGMRNGWVSPILQFVLVNNLMTQCVNSVLETQLTARTPFVIADAVFKRGHCQLNRCFRQGMLIQMLPQLSNVVSAGGSSDAQRREGSQQAATLLAQNLAQDPSCDGAQQGFDPLLLSIITAR